MYKERWKFERTNAWMDGFRAVLIRFDPTISSWMGGTSWPLSLFSLKNFTNQISLNNFNFKEYEKIEI